MEPTLSVALQLPDASASASAQLRRAAARLSLASPHGDASGTLHLAPPSFDAIKAAVTQAAATALARPDVTGVDADVAARGLDVVPLLSREQALRQLAVQSGTPLRLKVNGRARVSGSVSKQASGGGDGAPAWRFAGDLGLESVRLNQLKLWQKLAGRLALSPHGVSVHGKGLRASETLDLDLALPLLAQPGQAEAAEPAAAAEQQQLAAEAGAAEAEQHQQEQQRAQQQQQEQQGAEDSSAAATVEAAGAAAPPEPAAAAAAEQAVAAAPAGSQQQQGAATGQQQQRRRGGGGGLQMRCGPLQVAADIDATGSQLDFKVGAAGGGWGRRRQG